MSLNNFIIIFIGVLFNACAQLALKAGAKEITNYEFFNHFFLILKNFFNIYIFLGLSFYLISVILWIIALSRVQVSIAYPMQSIGYIVVLLFSFYLFNEPITYNKIIGISIIIFGVYLLTN